MDESIDRWARRCSGAHWTPDQQGFVPVGVYECTLDELRATFGTFSTSDRRPRLFAKLQAFIAEARNAQFVRWLVIDGSFVTGKPDPNDIDLLLVLASRHNFQTDLSLPQYRLVSKNSVRSRYGFDILAVREKTLEYEQAVGFFQQVRGQPARRKGLLRLTL